MLKKITVLFLVFFFGLHASATAGIEKLNETLDALGIEDMLPQSGIDFGRAADYLNWEQLNVSLKANMTSSTNMFGKTVRVDSVVYKKGLTGIRIDIMGGLQVQENAKTLSLVNCYLLEYPLKDKAFIVFPRKKGYMELAPEKIREMLGDRLEKSGKKKSTVQKKERQGTEEIDGRQCEKMHIVTVSGKGMKNDITTWLAKDLAGFPVKTLLQFELQRGQTGAGSIIFSTIVKGEQEEPLFELPREYEKYDNLVELATEGRRGSRLEKSKNRNRPFEKRPHGGQTHCMPPKNAQLRTSLFPPCFSALLAVRTLDFLPIKHAVGAPVVALHIYGAHAHDRHAGVAQPRCA
ncbi:MAG: hypothetical protein JW832_02105 [Deltaproteobacteria bacterium]|nr:hypothetical protein [Deltaproteobacteria bacterium]